MVAVEPALLRVGLLGELSLWRGDAALALPASRRTRALLGYLVAKAAPQSRSALCELLWEGPDDPRAALRWSLSKLRPLVDDALAQRLVADREHVAFDARHCEIDTVRVRALLSRGIAAAPLAALEQAAALLRGEFLDGLDLPDCYRFHHWCMAEREHHGVLRRQVLQALVARLEAEPGRALPHGRALVAADPLAEAAHATLVRLLAAAGRYPDAEQHYGWARELLRREVALPDGGALDDAIRAARRQLRQAATAVPAPPAVAAAVPAALQASGPCVEAHPLVGRQAERLAIAAALQAAPGRTRLLLFSGEPGIGKTRLLEHLAEQARRTGRRVLGGRCFQAEIARPYGLWLDTLRGLEGSPAEGAPAPAAPLLAGTGAAGGGNRQQLFESALSLLRGGAAAQPLVLLLDDLQWLDEGSAALLHFVARQCDGGLPLLLAGAARAGEVDDNPWTRALLQSLARDDRLQQLDVGPLGAEDALALAGAPAAAPEATVLLRRTGGNPLYLLELTRAQQRGEGTQAPGLDMLIGLRLQALDERGRDLLAWAAAMGRELRPELLAAATGLPLAQVLSQMEQLARRGLLVPSGAGALDFAHDLVREGVYRTLSQPRRRAIHLQLARVLEDACAADPGLHGEVARHAALAGDAPATARACLAAGEHCLRLFASGEALALAERGLGWLTELPQGTERTRLEVGLLRLAVLAATSTDRRQPALGARLERAIAAAEAFALHAEAAAGWEMLAFWRQQSCDTERSREATLAAQRATRRADAVTRCQQLANSGRCLLDIEADVARGHELLDEATALAEQLDLHLMELEWGHGLLERHAGRLDAARAALERATTLAELSSQHWREYECRVWAATLDHERGHPAEVRQQAGRIRELAQRMGEPRAPFAEALEALARLAEGETPAWQALQAALQALRELDDKAHLAYALNEAARLALQAGRDGEAHALAAEALAAAQAVRRGTEVAVAKAWLATLERDATQLPAPAAGEHFSARAAAALEAARGRIATLVPTHRP